MADQQQQQQHHHHHGRTFQHTYDGLRLMYRSSAHVTVGHVRSVLGYWTPDDITPQSVLYQLYGTRIQYQLDMKWTGRGKAKVLGPPAAMKSDNYRPCHPYPLQISTREGVWRVACIYTHIPRLVPGTDTTKEP